MADLVDKEDVVADVVAWLHSKKVSLWADFQLEKDGDYRRAAEWFIEQTIRCHEWRERQA